MKMIPSHETETATALAFSAPPIYLCHRARALVHSVGCERSATEWRALCIFSFFFFFFRCCSRSRATATDDCWTSERRKWHKETKRKLRQQIQGAVFFLQLCKIHISSFVASFISFHWMTKKEEIFSRLQLVCALKMKYFRFFFLSFAFRSIHSRTLLLCGAQCTCTRYIMGRHGVVEH